MRKGGGLSAVFSRFIDQIPDSRLLDSKPLSRAGNADAGVVIDESSFTHAAQKFGAFALMHGFGGLP